MDREDSKTGYADLAHSRPEPATSSNKLFPFDYWRHSFGTGIRLLELGFQKISLLALELKPSRFRFWIPLEQGSTTSVDLVSSGSNIRV